MLQFVILYPVAFTIGAQKAELAASSRVKPSGVEPTGIRPIASNFSLASGLASVVAAASLTCLANAGEAPAGSHIPYQASATRSMPHSFRVGASGRNGERVALVTARMRAPPARCCGMASVKVEIANGR